MTTTDEPPTRTPLDRARVLSSGVELADTEGLDAVSMRALATRLGVVPMALYKHVSDKDDLVNGMIDVVVGAYAAPEPGLDWRSEVRSRVLTARNALLDHVWLRRAIESSRQRSETVLGHMDAVAGALIAGGVSVDLTHHAMHALGNRIWGFSPEAFEDSATNKPSAEATPAEQEAMFRMMAQRFPNVTAIAMDSATRNPAGACNAQFEFEFTLDLLLDAFARLHDADWTSSGRG